MHSLTSALDGCEWSASLPGRFTPRGRAPSTHWIGGWGGPQSRSGHGVEEKNSQPLPRIEPRSPDLPAPSQSLYRLSYPGSWSFLYLFNFVLTMGSFMMAYFSPDTTWWAKSLCAPVGSRLQWMYLRLQYRSHVHHISRKYATCWITGQEQVHYTYCRCAGTFRSPCIRVIKSSNMRGAVNVARMGR
jgi:hypothetical protein